MNNFTLDGVWKQSDFAAINPFANREQEPRKKAKDNPKPPRQRKERKEFDVQAQAEAVERRKRVKDVVQYKKTVEQCQAVVKALEVVTVKLGFNLSDSSTAEARKHRRKGWHTFCALIMILCREYSARGIDAALSVPGKPCRDWNA